MVYGIFRPWRIILHASFILILLSHTWSLVVEKLAGMLSIRLALFLLSLPLCRRNLLLPAWTKNNISVRTQMTQFLQVFHFLTPEHLHWSLRHKDILLKKFVCRILGRPQPL
jgi:hypothetical protein